MSMKKAKQLEEYLMFNLNILKVKDEEGNIGFIHEEGIEISNEDFFNTITFLFSEVLVGNKKRS